MPLDESRLEKVHHNTDGSIRARCPACAEVGSDKTGNHLLVKSDGAYGCAANPGDKAHRERIFALAGVKESRERNGFSTHPQIVATYNYTDENGTLLFQKVRYAPKAFRQRRPDGNGGWSWNLNGVRSVLYQLPEVTEHIEKGCAIWIAEASGTPTHSPKSDYSLQPHREALASGMTHSPRRSAALMSLSWQTRTTPAGCTR
jgi:hypothetical protein